MAVLAINLDFKTKGFCSVRMNQKVKSSFQAVKHRCPFDRGPYIFDLGLPSGATGLGIFLVTRNPLLPSRLGLSRKLLAPPDTNTWCERRDSNSHALRRWNLNPVRLPIPPLSRCQSGHITLPAFHGIISPNYSGLFQLQTAPAVCLATSMERLSASRRMARHAPLVPIILDVNLLPDAARFGGATA
jgi:hypothetical protein